MTQNCEHYLEVSLPGTNEIMVISMYDIIGTNIYSTSIDDGLWVSIIENALGIYIQSSYFKKVNGFVKVQGFLKAIVLEYEYIPGLLNEIEVELAINLLTGEKTDSLEIKDLDLEFLHDNLYAFSKKSTILTAGVNCYYHKSNLDKDIDVITEIIIECHEYSILDYDPYEKMVKIRNPHGKGEFLNIKTGKPFDQVDDGVFVLHIKDFKKLFDNISYSEPHDVNL